LWSTEKNDRIFIFYFKAKINGENDSGLWYSIVLWFVLAAQKGRVSERCTLLCRNSYSSCACTSLGVQSTASWY